MHNYFHCQGKTILLMILFHFWQTARLFFNFYWQCGDQIRVNNVQWDQLSNHRRKHLDRYPCRKEIGTWTYSKALFWTTLNYSFYKSTWMLLDFSTECSNQNIWVMPTHYPALSLSACVSSWTKTTPSHWCSAEPERVSTTEKWDIKLSTALTRSHTLGMKAGWCPTQEGNICLC